MQLSLQKVRSPLSNNCTFPILSLKCTLCQVQKVYVLVNIAIFIWIVLLAALSYPFAYPSAGVKATAGEANPMP